MRLEFTEKQLEEQLNRFSNGDARSLPKLVKKTGACRNCGNAAYPYSTCRKCRERASVYRALRLSEDNGLLVSRRHPDDKRKKLWRLTDDAISKFEAEKKDKTYKRKDLKICRNSLCPCGSGYKYKKCCILKDEK